MTARKWRLRPAAPENEAILQSGLGISAILARLLVNRGITSLEQAEPFLRSRLSEHLRSPMLFRQMPAAAGRVLSALSKGERIGIYGDYDVDGISGTAILVRFLRTLGHEPLVHIPHRMRDGYGVTIPGIQRLVESGARLIITVDCGGVNHKELAFGREHGTDAIVCDHHQVSGTPLPAAAVLNPIEPDAGFPFRGLCGAGVAFYLTLGIRMRLRETGATSLPDLRRYLDLVTLGTVADIMPLVEENRILVKHGLRELTQTARPGIVALRDVSRAGAMSAETVGFRLAPRLNASGRLDDARRSLELLTTDDLAVAQTLATELDQENRTRQAIEKEILDDALRRIEHDESFADRRSIVLASTEWHPGVIGIVAHRLVERFHRPTVLLAIDAATRVGRGSGRSIANLDLYALFAECRDTLLGFGGHKMAAGLSIADSSVEAFAELFEHSVRARTNDASFIPEIPVDAELDFSKIDPALLDEIDLLEPFGTGNPGPVFFARDIRIESRRILKDKHVSLYLRQGDRSFSAIGFGLADKVPETQDRYDILFKLEYNDWQGNRVLRLRLRDIRPHAG